MYDVIRRLRKNENTGDRLYIEKNDKVNLTALAEALEHNTKLTELIIRDVPINPDAARALAKALKSNTALEEVTLTRTGLGPEGAIALAGALRHNRTLRVFSLQNNNIGVDGARAFARTIALTGRNNVIAEWDRVNVVTTNMIEEEKTKIKHENARAAVDAILLAGKNHLVPGMNYDVSRIVARKTWAGRNDNKWLFDPVACLGCFIGTPLFHEQHDVTRRFCSHRCQEAHYCRSRTLK